MVAAKYRVSVNLTAQEHKELAALSQKHQVSVSWLGRQAIAEFLERYKHEELQLPLVLPSKRGER